MTSLSSLPQPMPDIAGTNHEAREFLIEYMPQFLNCWGAVLSDGVRTTIPFDPDTDAIEMDMTSLYTLFKYIISRMNFSSVGPKIVARQVTGFEFVKMVAISKNSQPTDEPLATDHEILRRHSKYFMKALKNVSITTLHVPARVQETMSIIAEQMTELQRGHDRGQIYLSQTPATSEAEIENVDREHERLLREEQERDEQIARGEVVTPRDWETMHNVECWPS
ncbi:uncharacterized protein PAC_08699 [Phialocephala subalpina]|uniref:Uncharacterized protein n=1 Tax=Phialocephala subalpina TaxID=576137 RepID=A0A1L7X1B6_9HELO|nr:uncharacterized protein PAC_08699 [Phialocephala subalpina]